MRIEVSVPGIRKERGKLPPPTTLGALRLALPLAGRPLIWGELGGPAPCEPVTGTQVGAPVATAHPVSAKTKKSTTIGSRQRLCRPDPPRCDDLTSDGRGLSRAPPSAGQSLIGFRGSPAAPIAQPVTPPIAGLDAPAIQHDARALASEVTLAAGNAKSSFSEIRTLAAGAVDRETEWRNRCPL